MDLGFSSRQGFLPTGAVPVAGTLPVDLPVLLAAAAAYQAVSPTARHVASALDHEQDAQDMIHGLVQLFALRRSEYRTVASLAGSFNPLVARQFTVGQ